MPFVTIARDALLTGLMAVAWWVESRHRGAGDGVALVSSAAAGVLTAVVGFLVHEWAHLAGARLYGSEVRYPNRWLAPLLFHFDTTTNDRRQFLAMSYGGYLGSALGTAAIVAWAPLEALSGRIALGLASAGLLVTALAEVPTTVRVLRGGPLPRGYAFDPPS
jgi:hypothetical protein